MSAVPTSFISPEVVQGTTTSWLPVTTAYPQLAGCSSAFFLYPGQPFPYGFDPGYGYFAGGDLSCEPPAMTTWWEQGHQNPDGFTSLSIRPIVCPEAWTTAATESRSGSSTLVMCCPSGYDLSGGQPGRVAGICKSPLSAGQTITYTAQDANFSWIPTTLSVTSATAINAVAMEGWNVAASTTSSSPATSTSTSTSSPSSTSIPLSSSGLSTGAKAGIGIGAAALAIGILFLLLFFFHRQRKQRQSPHNDNNAARAKPNEAGSSGVHEMHQKRGPVYEIQPKQAQVYEMHQGQGQGQEQGQGQGYGHVPVELESR